MVKILSQENPVLREVAKEVPLAEISSVQIKKTIDDMKKALASQDDGVAIAAPQIGKSWRIVVVSSKVFKDHHKESELSRKKDAKDLVLINPKIIRQSKKKSWVEEGCLSVRWLYGKTKRADKTTVEANDEKGKLFTYGGSGLLSQIFQHEIDHLNGILFIDHAKDLEEMTPPKRKKEHNEKL